MRQGFAQLQERFHQRQQQCQREHETVMDLLPPPEPAQQQQQQQQRGIPTSVIVRAPPRNLAMTQLFPDVQPSTSGVQQSGQGKKRSYSATVEPESQSESPRSSPAKKQTKWIIASNEREAELRQCEKEFYEQQGEPQLWDNEDNENLRACIRQHVHHMVDCKIPRRRSMIYYKFLDHECSLSDNIRDTFESIYQDQGQSFKTNVSLSFVLQHRETDEYRFYYVSRNNRLLLLPR